MVNVQLCLFSSRLVWCFHFHIYYQTDLLAYFINFLEIGWYFSLSMHQCWKLISNNILSIREHNTDLYIPILGTVLKFLKFVLKCVYMKFICIALIPNDLYLYDINSNNSSTVPHYFLHSHFSKHYLNIMSYITYLL